MCQVGRHVNKTRCAREGDTSTKRDVSGRVVELNMLGMGSRRGYNWVTGQSDIVSLTTTTFGSTATYECDTGYVLVGGGLQRACCPEVSSPAQ